LLLPERNRCEFGGRLVERSALRYTPAGVPVIECRIAHRSEQIEADCPRHVECELACLAVGSPALLLKDAPPGTLLAVSGFLAAKSLRQAMPVLHVLTIEFNEHCFSHSLRVKD